MQPIRNFCIVETATGYDALATEIALIANDGLKLPDPALEGPFNLVWFNFTDYKNPSDDPYKEIIKVTGRNIDKIAVVRGQGNIAATAKNMTGKIYKMILTLTKESYDEIVPGYHGKISTLEDGNIIPEELGENAVDFQFSRLNKNQCASGCQSFVAGGSSNKAAGINSFAANVCNTASGQNSSAIGSENISEGENSFTNGERNIARNTNTIATGAGSKARLIGQAVRSNHFNSAPGDAQASSLILKADTAGENASDLKLNTLGGIDGMIILEDNTSYLFRGIVLGKSGNLLSVGYEIKGIIQRGANAASTELIGNIQIDRICDLSLGCDIIISADRVNGALKITVQGEADKFIRWICQLDWIEIKP